MGNIVYIAVIGLLVWGGSSITAPPLPLEPEETGEASLALMAQTAEGHAYPDDFYCGASLATTVPRQLYDDTLQRWNLYDTPEAAMDNLDFRFRIPNSSLTNGVFQVCVETDGGAGKPAVNIYTKSGIMYKAFFHDYPVDYEKWVGWNRDEWEQGMLCTDRPPEAVEARGRKAWSIEPGFTRPCRNPGVDPRPGKLYFWEADIEYWMTGTSGDAAFTVEQLVEVAESFE